MEGSRIRREVHITDGRIEGKGRRGKRDIVDHMLEYRNYRLAVVEVKACDEPLTLAVRFTQRRLPHDFAEAGTGVEELDQDKLAPLLKLKYHNSIAEPVADHGNDVGQSFAGFQKYLYREGVA